MKKKLGISGKKSYKAPSRKNPAAKSKVTQCSGSKITMQERSQILFWHNEYRSQLAAGKVRTDTNYMPRGSDIRKLVSVEFI